MRPISLVSVSCPWSLAEALGRAEGWIEAHLALVRPVVISLRYHRLHPEYLHQRIEKLAAMYQLRVLLVMCDVVSPNSTYALVWVAVADLHPPPHPATERPPRPHPRDQQGKQHPCRLNFVALGPDPLCAFQICIINNLTVMVCWT